MKTSSQPMVTTLVFGVLCGLATVLFLSASRWSLFQDDLFEGMIWVYLAIYGWLLTRWSKISFFSILFPLALPLLLLFFKVPLSLFFVFSLFILSWVRSGLCFPGKLLGRFGLELSICFGGAALIRFLSPHSSLSWGLGVWLFFLIQSLYFLSRTRPHNNFEEGPAADPFEKARRKAEEILGLEK